MMADRTQLDYAAAVRALATLVSATKDHNDDLYCRALEAFETLLGLRSRASLAPRELEPDQHVATIVGMATPRQ